MTQHFIRKVAGYGPVRRAWMKLWEPRIVSAIYGIWYVILAIVWGSALISHPLTVETIVGGYAIKGIGAVITIGAIWGIAMISTGTYWAERTAVKLIALGYSGYFVLVISLAFFSDVNRAPAAATILGALMVTLFRLWWVNERTFHPDKTHNNT